MDLFSIFLQSAFDWGFGRILDTVFCCSICEQRKDESIGNEQQNYLECPNCHKVVQQYTNACDFTVNKRNGQIGHGIFDVGSYSWKWATGNGPLDFNKEFLGFPFNIKIAGLKDRSVIFQLLVRNFNNDQLVVSDQKLLSMPYNITSWTDYTIYFHNNKFQAEDKGILTVDARILSEYKDILYEDRRIVKPWKD